MTGAYWRQHENEQRQREASLTLGQKLSWLDDAIETAIMLGWQVPNRETKVDMDNQRQQRAPYQPRATP